MSIPPSIAPSSIAPSGSGIAPAQAANAAGVVPSPLSSTAALHSGAGGGNPVVSGAGGGEPVAVLGGLASTPYQATLAESTPFSFGHMVYLWPLFIALDIAAMIGVALIARRTWSAWRSV